MILAAPLIALALGFVALMPCAVPAQTSPAPAPADISKVPQAAEAPLELLMVERNGCVYCEAWRREIMPQYMLTPEGKVAPLRRVQIDGPWPDGIALARRPYITPTFILLQDGKEVGRLEGYAGEDFFFPLLDNMIAAAGVSLPPAHSGG